MTVGLLSLVRRGQGSVLNLGGTDSALAYINVLKGTGANGQGAFNTDGYPTAAPASTVSLGSITLPSTYSGNWVYQHTGKGSIRIDRGAGFTIVSGGAFVVGSTAFNLFIDGTDARVVFRFTGSPATSLTINWPTVAAGSGGYTGMSGADLVRADLEASYLAGEIYNPDFLATINALNPGIIRLLDWASVNNSNSASYSTRRQTTAFTWHPTATVYDTTLYAGTTSTGDSYTVSAPSGWRGLVNRATVQVIFANTNKGTSPTLAVGGTAAKTIKRLSGAALQAASELPTSQIDTLVYDSTLDAWLRNNVVGVTGTGLILGVPYEAQIALCNKLSKPLWMQIPHLWSDSDATSVVGLAASSLTKQLYLEYSNEFWNTGFVQTNWGNRVATVLGFATGAYHSLYGLRFSQIIDAATPTWTETRAASDLIPVLAFQAYGDNSITGTYRLAGGELGSYGFNAAPNRPADKAGALSYAHYFAGGQLQGFGVCSALLSAATTAATDYASGVPARMASAFAFMDNDARRGTCNGSLAQETLLDLSTTIYPRWEARAVTYGKPVIAYEGGYQVIKPTVAQLNAVSVDGTTYAPLFATLIDAFKNDDLFKQLIADHYGQFIAQPHSLRPAWYYFGPGSNQWSLYPGSIEKTPLKSYNAISDYNRTS